MSKSIFPTDKAAYSSPTTSFLMNRYEQTKKFILGKLSAELPSTLTYHSYSHVLDVLTSAEMLCEKEKISPEETELVKVSALFHDSGFMLNAVNHEQIGCDMAKKLLPEFGYKEDEIDKICGMILATKFPQQPNTLLEEILCDADLDYLGRPDFFSIGNTLFEELKASKTLSTAKDWNQLQVNFLLTHKYFTRSAKELRAFQKEVHLQQITNILARS